MGDAPPPEPSNRVYVGSLDHGFTQQQMEEEVRPYGKATSVWVAHNPAGFAFIEFTTIEEAEACIAGLQDKRLGEQNVKVGFAKNKGRKPPPPGGNPNRVAFYGHPEQDPRYGGTGGPAAQRRMAQAAGNGNGGGGGGGVRHRLVLRNLPPSFTWRELKDEMKRLGDVIYADVDPYGDGLVEFSTEGDLEYAIQRLDGTSIDGHRIAVQRNSQQHGGGAPPGPPLGHGGHENGGPPPPQMRDERWAPGGPPGPGPPHDRYYDRGPPPGPPGPGYGPPPPRYDERGPPPGGPPPPRYDDHRGPPPPYDDRYDHRGPPPPRYDDHRGPPPPRYDDRYDPPPPRGPPPPRYEGGGYDSYYDSRGPPPGPPPPHYDRRGYDDGGYGGGKGGGGGGPPPPRWQDEYNDSRYDRPEPRDNGYGGHGYREYRD